MKIRLVVGREANERDADSRESRYAKWDRE